MLQRGESAESWNTVTQTLLDTLDQDIKNRQHLRSSSLQQKLSPSLPLSPPPIAPPLTVALKSIPATIEIPMMPAKGGVPIKPAPPLTVALKAIPATIEIFILPAKSGVMNLPIKPIPPSSLSLTIIPVRHAWLAFPAGIMVACVYFLFKLRRK